MAFDFSGKRVWVTGAGRGIGREVATQFVAVSACVVGLDLAFPEADYPYATRLLDIGDSKAVNACCAALLADGGLDVLVNGAGVLRLGSTETLSDDDWHDCMTVNASGVFYLLRALVPHFKGQRRGAIVTIGSNAAHVPRMQMAAYCASKAAVTSLTQTVGLELAPSACAPTWCRRARRIPPCCAACCQARRPWPAPLPGCRSSSSSASPCAR